MASGEIARLNKKLILKRYSYTFSGGINANTSVRVLPEDMTPSFHYPDGYTPIAIRYFNTGSVRVVVDYICAHNHDGIANAHFLAVRNATSTNVTTDITFTIDILFAPVEIVEIITT